MDPNIHLNSKNSKKSSNSRQAQQGDFMIIDDEYHQTNINNNSSNSNNKKKWRCPQCTYENWPSALKCTICYSVNTTATHKPKIKKKNFIISNKTNNSINDLTLINQAPTLYDIELLDNKKLLKQQNENNEIINKIGNLKLNSDNNLNELNVNNNLLASYSSQEKIDQIPTAVSLSNQNNNNEADIETKWSCSTCTYLNWPKSLKCVQCYTPKPQIQHQQQFTNDSSSSANSSISNEIINSSVTNGEQIANNAILLRNNNQQSSPLINNRSLCNSPCTVPKIEINNNNIIRPHNENSAGITVNNSNEQSPTTKKWPCSVCTYQNWPKSQRCVMCHAARFPSNTNVNKNKKQTQKYNNSNNKNNNNNIINIQINNHNQNHNNNLNNKFINYQIQMDRLFLSACHGVVDGDITNLNLYVTAGGDLTRHLTLDECNILNGKFNINSTEIGNKTNSEKNDNNKLEINDNENSHSIFQVGHTLIHICYQFKRKDILIKLLNQSNTLKNLYLNNNKTISLNKNTTNNVYINNKTKVVNNNTRKFSPCQSCPSLATNIIDRYFSSNLRQRKLGTLDGRNNNNNSPTSSLITLSQHQQQQQHPSPSPSPPPVCGALHNYYNLNHYIMNQSSLCFFVNESHTFTLPSEIEDFSPRTQHVLFDQLLDRDVQNELENESRIINWNMDLCKRLNSRLYPLWNRHSGDCLLDSVLQACYGVFDTDNTLRRIMAESLEQFSNFFKPRWREHEILMAQSLEYKPDDYQLEQDWNNILALASQPGASLEQAHIFALCHIFRRPIIVYSVRVIKSFRGENIGFTNFEGVYLPLIWDPSFCFKTPIALGYTRGHFTALVPLERPPELFYPYYNNAGATSGEFSINKDHNKSLSNSSINLAVGGATACLINNRNNNCNLNGSNNNLSENKNENNNETSSSSSNSNNNNNATNNLLGAVSYLDHNSENKDQQQVFYLPLTNNEGQLLPIHFLNSAELGRERSILSKYLNLDCFVMPGSNCALLVAQQRVAKRGMLVKQMLEEWLNYYRNMQSKEEYSHQIEISHDKENDMIDMCNLKNQHLLNINKNNTNNKTNNQKEMNNFMYNHDDEDDDEDDDDEDDDDEDDEEDEYEDEYYEEVNVQ